MYFLQKNWFGHKNVKHKSLKHKSRVGWRLVAILILMLTNLAFAAPNALVATTKTEESTTNTPTDTYGRTTPRSTVNGFMTAIIANDNELAAQYLDNDFVKNSKKPKETLIHEFKTALDMGGRLHGDLQLSDEAAGNLSDNLPDNQEKVGSITIGDDSMDVLLVRHTDRKGVSYWQFSKDTLKNLPSIDQKQPTLADRFGLSKLNDRAVFGFNLGDVVALILLIAMSISLCYAFVWLVFVSIRFIYPKLSKKEFAITPTVILPLTIVIVALWLPEIMLGFGVPVVLRSPVERVKEVVAWIATAWLVLRVIDALFNRAEARSLRQNRPEQVSLFSLLRKVAKALMVILAAIVVFGNLGFDLTTGIAALGVGGLALAFGAQKTIENLIGSVVVVADRPVRVGDYCRFGNLEGTVIDIGIRSSRIRTLNRTVVTVPNGDFSAMQIENFATRDMFHFLHNLYIARDADPDELGRMMRELQMFISNHEYVNTEWTQVHITEMRQDCFVVQMRCYIDARNAIEFYGKQSELILDILNQVKNYQVAHALPSQTINVVAPQSDDTTCSDRQA